MCRARLGAHAGARAGSRTCGCVCVCVRACVRVYDNYIILLYMRAQCVRMYARACVDTYVHSNVYMSRPTCVRAQLRT